jgi:NAD(P)-dependent dehydrogenase (short-subunit alcohol dehydrogenase family)
MLRWKEMGMSSSNGSNGSNSANTLGGAMAGKVVLVTGATDGIGKVTLIELARMGATVVGVGRNSAKAESVLAEARRESGNPNIDFLIADLSSMAEVRRVAADFRSRYDRLDVLVNNAGAVIYERKETVDGFEYTFGLNHLSYFLLTNELLDMLKASSPSRVVSVSSNAHQGQSLNFDDLQSTRFSSFGAYGKSKLANILFSNELARRLEGTGVTSNSLHPGFVRTHFGRSGPGYITGPVGLLQRLLAITPEKGAETMIYLASSPEVEGVSGKYFAKSAVAKPTAQAQNVDDARRLWEVSEQLVAQTAAVAA